MAEGSSPDDDDDEKLFLGSLRASRAINKSTSKSKREVNLFYKFYGLLNLNFKNGNAPSVRSLAH